MSAKTPPAPISYDRCRRRQQNVGGGGATAAAHNSKNHVVMFKGTSGT